MSNELRKHLENCRKPVGEFQREDRYIVIKRSDLKKVPASYRSHLVDPMFSLLAHLPNRECLVIESDWPEYEPAWKAIQARMSGEAPQPPALGGEPLVIARVCATGGPHDSEDRALVEQQAELPPVGTDLIDRAHLTALKVELARMNAQFDELAAAVGFTKERCEQAGDSPLDCANQLQQQAMWQRVGEDDLSGIESFLNQTSAYLIPADVATLSNYAMHCIREVRASRVEIEGLKMQSINDSEANTAIRAERDAYKALSVTNIMLDVVPGDGSGHEVYARSVSDVEAALTGLSDKLEAAEGERDQLKARRDELEAGLRIIATAGTQTRAPDLRLKAKQTLNRALSKSAGSEKV